jgi:hypothetical protein
VHAEQLLSVGPHLFRNETTLLRQLLKFIDRVLVGIFGMQRFARGEAD